MARDLVAVLDDMVGDMGTGSDDPGDRHCLLEPAGLPRVHSGVALWAVEPCPAADGIQSLGHLPWLFFRSWLHLVDGPAADTLHRLGRQPGVRGRDDCPHALVAIRQRRRLVHAHVLR
jgi:hypothetical protein